MLARCCVAALGAWPGQIALVALEDATRTRSATHGGISWPDREAKCCPASNPFSVDLWTRPPCGLQCGSPTAANAVKFPTESIMVKSGSATQDSGNERKMSKKPHHGPVLPLSMIAVPMSPASPRGRVVCLARRGVVALVGLHIARCQGAAGALLRLWRQVCKPRGVGERAGLG